MVNPKSEETHEHKKINKIKEEKKQLYLFIYCLKLSVLGLESSFHF